MKVLYAIQGTGNGHLSRALDLIPAIQKYCEVDVLVSGYQSEVTIPFPVKFRYRGLSFVFGKKGGVDLWNTYLEAKMKLLHREINDCPVENYDFVINDFEPVSAWACYKKKVPCVSLSHQAAVLDPNSPKPDSIDVFGKFILRNYAPSNVKYGLHFGKYSNNIFTPIIRQEVRNLNVTDKGHYTVYLPAYDDEKILKTLQETGTIKWQVFSKHSKILTIKGNILIQPINNESFLKSMSSCRGVLCGAGFETPAEAMLLGKKLMVIPMKSQYEQQCNAFALKEMGVSTLKKLKKKNVYKILNWVESDNRININYPDITDKIASTIFEHQVLDVIIKNQWETDYKLSFDKSIDM